MFGNTIYRHDCEPVERNGKISLKDALHLWLAILVNLYPLDAYICTAIESLDGRMCHCVYFLGCNEGC